ISQCARVAIRTYLVPPDSARKQQWCALCHRDYPASTFCSSNSPIYTRRSLIQQESEVGVIKLPPRMCCWHAGRLTRLVRNAVYVCIVGQFRAGQNAAAIATAVRSKPYSP
ncbi:hypothetical protein COCC4DRAFT_86359, partial [Bipolaris maydis ATCC 48331]